MHSTSDIVRRVPFTVERLGAKRSHRGGAIYPDEQPIL
jgi:hypothetical protein